MQEIKLEILLVSANRDNFIRKSEINGETIIFGSVYWVKRRLDEQITGPIFLLEDNIEEFSSYLKEGRVYVEKNLNSN